MLTRIVSGVEVEYTPEEEQSTRDEWLVNSTENITDIKADKLDELGSAFGVAVSEDVTYSSVVYQSGKDTRTNLGLAISNYIAAANTIPAGFEWIAKDNTGTPFTATNIIELAEIVGDQWTVAFARYQTKKAAVRAVDSGDEAADIITVKAIVW